MSSIAHCSEVVVGGGWAGLYFAYRSLERTPAASLCLFESSARIGGRTFSISDELDVGDGKLTLDIGAYRFSPDMHLPGDLILKKLKLPTACYEPGCPSAKLDMPNPFIFNYSAPLRRIVNPKTGLPSGYATPLFEMVRELRAAGVTIALNHELVGLSQPAANGKPILQIKTPDSEFPVSISPNLVLLNVPRARLLPLPGVAAAFGSRAMKALSCVRFDKPAGDAWKNWTITDASFTALSKAYLGYDDAWWVTKLNISRGEYPENAFFPIKTSKGIDIGIRWSDGPVTCKNDASGFTAGVSSTSGQCSGYLEAYYAVSNETFFRDVSGEPMNPLGTVRASNPHGNETLAAVHSALLEAIAPLLRDRGVTASSIPAPRQMVVGVWARPDKTATPIGPPYGYTAPTKVYYVPELVGPLSEACGVEGLTEAEYRMIALQPLGKEIKLYMANNDWVAMNTRYMFGDWAEETLLQAERALRSLGATRPSWLDADYYEKKIAGVLDADLALVQELHASRPHGHGIAQAPLERSVKAVELF